MSETTVQDLVIDKLDKQDNYLRKHDEKLDKILEQALKTNGRVNTHDARLDALETKIHSPEECPISKSLIEMKTQIKGFSKMMAWGLGIFGSLFLFLLGIAFKIIKVG
ncbi:MAG: hypothetical protein KA968_14715 [Chitinophagaceae bacterium]|nr:hypothetical protein [Chitinophagaceae bacterium]